MVAYTRSRIARYDTGKLQYGAAVCNLPEMEHGAPCHQALGKDKQLTSLRKEQYFCYLCNSKNLNLCVSHEREKYHNN